MQCCGWLGVCDRVSDVTDWVGVVWTWECGGLSVVDKLVACIGFMDRVLPWVRRDIAINVSRALYWCPLGSKKSCPRDGPRRKPYAAPNINNGVAPKILLPSSPRLDTLCWSSDPIHVTHRAQTARSPLRPHPANVVTQISRYHPHLRFSRRCLNARRRRARPVHCQLWTHDLGWLTRLHARPPPLTDPRWSAIVLVSSGGLCGAWHFSPRWPTVSSRRGPSSVRPLGRRCVR